MVNMIRSVVLTVIFSCTSLLTVFAGEGMWLPLLLKALNEEEMQGMGMKMSAEDIYSVNQGSLKDAIAHFGGFCTSEVISDQGLLLTNHHCGYSEIQSHSTLENNYLKDGFWADSKGDELPNPGLFAKFIERIEDVSAIILEGTENVTTDAERNSIIDKNITAYKATLKLAKFRDIEIKPFFNTNQYFAFITISYPDVRLVGAPPESIGKFGADTDNWEWPRHTGDFALFRIYADENNEPAEYSPNNVAYAPKHSLPISLDGVEEGDFTLVFGFPGRTRQYLPSHAVKQTLEVLNPAKIQIRENALDIVGKKMREDAEIKLKYASKFASIANYWKKWIGESLGLEKTNALDKKRAFEKELVSRNPEVKRYLKEFDQYYSEIEPYALVKDYYSEISGRNVELLRVASITKRLLDRYENNGEDAYNGFAQRVIPFFESLYKNYDPNVDKLVFESLIEMYKENLDAKYVPAGLRGSAQALADKVYSNSILADGDKLLSLLKGAPKDAMSMLSNDAGYQLYTDWSALYNEKAATKYSAINAKIDSLQRLYMKSQMLAFPEKKFYPDANSTMRVTYGQVNGYEPKDGVWYNPVTSLGGVIAKYVPDDYEFDVHPKLIELYQDKDYGQYADSEGKMPVCFLGSNHTTGGNSGSPAIDAYGNLIGLNFDRVWEGTMSDINYDKSICRNIMVDARYILFVIDKFANAGHLIDEMQLVNPKSSNINLINPTDDGKTCCKDGSNCGNCDSSMCTPDGLCKTCKKCMKKGKPCKKHKNCCKS